MAIFSAIAAVGAAIGSFIGGLGVIGSFLLRTAVGIGLNLLAQAISGKPKDPTFSINGTLQGGGDLPRSFIIGRTATAGSLVWANTWGKDGDSPNAYLTQVIALSDLPVKGLLNVWVNNERVTLDLVTPDMSRGWQVKEYRNNGDNLWVKFYDGTQTVADSFLVNTCSNGNRAWSSNRVGRGVAYVIVTARVSKNMFSGIPSFKFEVDGYPMYDPTRDSSVGGVGAQRLSDPSTWGGDGDHLPAVQNYNLLRGIYLDGKWFYGVQGMSNARLPTANWIEAINKCRAPVAGATGNEPQYRSGGEISIDAPLSAALEAINSTCQGRISEIGGVYHQYLGAPDAPVVHFTDEDILSTEEQSFTPFFGLADTINGISATYPSPADGWVIKTAPPLYRTDLEARHGNRRLMASVELSFVPYAEQVQRLMKSALEEGQRARRHTHVLPPRFWPYAVPGRVFSWTSKRNGYVNKLMRVDGAADRANLDIMVDLTEVDPTDYKWQSNTDYKPPIDGSVGPMRPLPQPIVDFSADAGVAQDNNGNNRRCAILLGWDGDQDDVDLVMYEIRTAWDLSVIFAGRTERVSVGSMLVAPGMLLLPTKSYQIRARYATYAGNRPFEWSDWIPVTMFDIRLGPLDIYPIPIEQLNEDVQRNLAWIGDSFRYVQEELDRIGAQASEQDSANLFAIKTVREEVSVTAQGLTASYTKAIEVAIGPGSAIVTRIESLEAIVTDPVTGLEATATAVDLLQAKVTTLDGVVTATANSVTALSATVGNFSASGLFRTTVEATPSGALARIGLSVSATGGGATSQAAIFLDALTGGQSRIVMNADQLILTNGTNSKAPFTFISGEATMMVGRVAELYSGIIRSFANNVVFNLDAGTLIFSDNT